MSIKLKEFELTWSWKSFENLSKEEVYEILSFRQSIFVVEQESWYLDADALDQESEHLIVKYKDKLIGYLRLVPPGIIYKTASLGRIAIDKTHRGKGLGSKLVEEGLKRTECTYSSSALTISAQEYLIGFYQDHGFEVSGEAYDEDGIPHIKMFRDG